MLAVCFLSFLAFAFGYCFTTIYIDILSESDPVYLNTYAAVTLSPDQSQTYYVDVSNEVQSRYILPYLKVVWFTTGGTGFLQATLKRGNGDLFSLTLPEGNWYESSGDITSETVPGDSSGRWHLTLFSCKCTGSTSQASFKFLVTVEDLYITRRVFYNNDLSFSLKGSQSRLFVIDPVRDPNVTFGDNSIPIFSFSQTNNATAFVKSWLRKDVPPTSEYDVMCPTQSIKYETSCSLTPTYASLNTYINQYLSLHRYNVLIRKPLLHKHP
eukprot:TRINITY_DN6373_c0_g1_i24.p1 TRINITY_DN6373_c0_g1~~TRINITY_DN6373_c0_g1_i24.p1  ORF type:complete len:269 (+),score=18.68 TRINITY_DN6373_c0_g1_i24:89-895(+)